MRASRLAQALLAAAVFGLLAGFVKGDVPGLRGGLGNLSTPWLLVALVPAWWSGSWQRGILVGTAATLVGLLGFYVATTVYLHGHLGVEAGPLGSLRYVVSANRIWFVAGLLSGPVCGAVGGWLGARRPTWWLGAIAGGLMVAEIVVVRLAEGVRVPGLNVAWGIADWRAYELQAVAGLVVVALTALVWRPRARATR